LLRKAGILASFFDKRCIWVHLRRKSGDYQVHRPYFRTKNTLYRNFLPLSYVLQTSCKAERKDGVSPVILMDIFNHTSFAITRRYLGLTQKDKDIVYLGLVVF